MAALVAGACSDSPARLAREEATPDGPVTPSASPSASPTELPPGPSSRLRLELVEKIDGYISPKSVVASQTGLFFAQNMMYKHTVSVYDREFQLLKTIPDEVSLGDYGYEGYSGSVKGAPVEAAFSPDGQYAYVSQYSMFGPGFGNPGTDACQPSDAIDDSFVYRIKTDTLLIDEVIRVGAVPKYVAVTPDNRYVLVANWCSYDLSVIDVAEGTEIERIPLGQYPRGIAVDSDSTTAYVGVFGTDDIARLDLQTFEVGWIRDVGSEPRHLNISPDDERLYVTLNDEGAVIALDLSSGEVVDRVETGTYPRSMAISADGESLYVVNYGSSTLTKLRASDLSVLQTVPTEYHPIGVTHDAGTNQVWVACYGGTIMVFQDSAA